MRISRESGSPIIRLRKAVKTHRQQIGVVLVSLTLGLVIILNVAMVPAGGPVTDPERKPIQFTQFNKKTPDKSTVIQ